MARNPDRKRADLGGFEPMYQGGAPPWDIGRPQGAFVELEKAGKVKGSVLDVGCGTGENVLFFASKGHEAWGVDGAPTAVAAARAKAKARGSRATFVHGSVLDLGALGRTFDTVIDSGMFHTLTDAHRLEFERSLRGALPVGGDYFMMCFNEHEAGDYGPRRVTKEEIRLSFAKGWKVKSIETSRFEHFLGGGGAHAWLAHIVREP
jgi:cyclopropane fatty-acyl-phospholipid synthase-like methyltransferase